MEKPHHDSIEGWEFAFVTIGSCAESFDHTVF